MSAITSFFRRVLIFLPFTLPLWLAPSLPTLGLNQAVRTVPLSRPRPSPSR